jgi:hypothetical protein
MSELGTHPTAVEVEVVGKRDVSVVMNEREI